MNTQNSIINSIKGSAEGYCFSHQALRRDSNSPSTTLPRFIMLMELAQIGLQINAAIPHPSQTLVSKTLYYMPWIGGAINWATTSYPDPSLSPLTRRACSFLAEHYDEMSIAAMGAGAVGLAALGNHAYGASILAAITYNILDQRGHIDGRISQFIARFMPPLSCAAIIATNGFSFLSFNAAMQLPHVWLLPSQNIALQYQVDHLSRRIFGAPNVPSLEELEGPLKPHMPWNFHEIEEILSKSADDFELNPAHLSKPLHAYVNLPEDREFATKIPAVFNNIIWDNDHILLKLMLCDHFLNFITQKLSDIDKQDLLDISDEDTNLYQKIRECIAQVAQQTRQGMTAKEFIGEWVRTRVTNTAVRLEEDLTSNTQNLVEIKKRCAQLFWCIPRLDNKDQIKVLLTFANATEHLSWMEIDVIAPAIIEQLLENENTRNVIVEDSLDKATVIAINKYKQIRKNLLEKEPQGKIPHFQAGLYPILQPARLSFATPHVIVGLKIASAMRENVYTQYKTKVFRDLNTLWSQEEITSWIRLLLPNAAENGPLITRSCQAGQEAAFHNLLLYHLGILRLKS